jgi:hypothetical protein
MKRIVLSLAIIFAGCLSAFGQASIFPQNNFYAGPSSGGQGFPTPRAIVGADLPNPSASTLGGIQSLTCAANQWLNSISVAGIPACAQPSFTNLSGSLAASQLPAFTGDTTSPAGSSVNTTVKVNGVAFGTSPSTDTVPVVTAANTATYTGLPNCTSGIIQYSTSTHLFSCGAAGSGTVQSVTCGAGLSGGTFTTTGTCAAALPYFSANLSANQTVTAGTATVLSANTTIFDSNSWYNNTTFKYTPQLAGKYRVNARIVCAPTSSTLSLCSASILKNGAAYSTSTSTTAATQVALSSDAIIAMNGSTDFIQAQGQINCTGTPCLLVGGTAPIQSYVEAQYVSP